MAYINAESVAVIRKDLKAAFPYVKFSVTLHDYSSVRVVVLAAPFNFLFASYQAEDKHDFQVNPYYISADDEAYQKTAVDCNNESASYGDHGAYVFLRAVKAIITKNWWDKSDLQSDYHNTAFYYDISVGQWNHGFVKTEWPKGVEHLVDTPAPVEEALDVDASVEQALACDAFAQTLADVITPKDDLNAEPYAAFISEELRSHRQVIFYKTSEVETGKVSHFKFWRVFTLSDAKAAIDSGFLLLDDEIEEKYKAEKGYDIGTYFERIAKGIY